MMKRDDVTNMYKMEELIPIVGMLAEKFTSKESSSVTYERARQLMESVIYCIAHMDENLYSLTSHTVLSAKEAYKIGYDAVVEKVRRTQKKYNELMGFFDHYYNRNYRDTVEKALPGFFLYYNVKFAPTDYIITLDYPIFGLDLNLEGIDMIDQYIDAIWKEQKYLMRFPRNYILSELRSFHPKYEKEYFNLREIIELQMNTSM
ncbi:MAG: DUF6179 domain-containing protein [Lachnospiraceae bacterium]